ncbi:unnamed protein product, partial [Thlaspi arvense]
MPQKLRSLNWTFFPMTCLPSKLNPSFRCYEKEINYCSNLVKLPSSIGNAINLKELCLIHCLSLVEFLSSIGNTTN